MSIMTDSKLRIAGVFSLAILVGLFFACQLAHASSPSGQWNVTAPQGPYAIGHTTLVLIDRTRNPDGSTPVTSEGRPLYVQIWYPTSAKPTQRIRYTWNNPIYNDNPGSSIYPGLPHTPPLTFAGSLSSHLIAQNTPLAKGRFPLIVATHGYEVASGKNLPDTLETLASNGYIVASVEHTGDDDAWYQTYFMEHYLGLQLGPNPSIYADTIYQRVKDVNFVISEMLDGQANGSGLPFAKQIDPKRIGVIGYSLGGMTALATVTGISSMGLPADRRVKAAFMGAGTNYGLLLNASDYANARVPLMFFGNDTGIAYSNFNSFSNAPVKYLVDIAAWNHHIGQYQTGWCQDIHNSMVAVNPAVFPAVFSDPGSFSPSDIANYVFDATFYWVYTGPYEDGVYNFCGPSVFNGVTDAQLTAVLFGNPQIVTAKNELEQDMPLERQLPIAESTELTNQYAVKFFDGMLQYGDHAAPGDHAVHALYHMRMPAYDPLVRVTKNCERVQAHPFNLTAGDQIKFVPAGDDYEVSVRSGRGLLDAGSTKLAVSGNGTAMVSYPGFAFPVPGYAHPFSKLFVSEDGAITTRTSGDYTGVDDNGSPWYMRGQLLLTDRLTIGALMKDLDSTASGAGVFARYDAAHHRVIVTYDNVPAAGTTGTNTLQVVIYNTGEIDITIGQLADTGPNYAPGILGTIGIASGETRAADFRHVRPIDFASLLNRPPAMHKFADGGAIYEQYYKGISASCSDGQGDLADTGAL